MSRLLSVLCVLAALSACQRETPIEVPAHDHDAFTHANTLSFVTRHLALDLDVDFDARELRGTATLFLTRNNPAERTVVLDGRSLAIESAQVKQGKTDWQAATVEVGETDPILGEPIRVTLPKGFEPQGEFELQLAYRTSPGATALQWLPGTLTTSGEPLLFSQSQSIHARSWVPLQDTPAMRITYEAVIRTPPDMRALMSADNDPAAVVDGEYHFQMPQPIPPYLLALAVGRLDFATLGPDTGVYAEPEMLDAAAHEFADTQYMVELAVRHFGPYDWGRYDLLVLPPSFPYGGMENPRLSFITPSLLAGDRSLVNVIAHELAHSWSGNLVTNATWHDIWLNEGTTSYLEARLMEELYGVDRADEERVLAYAELLEDFARVPQRLQALAPQLEPTDGPDAQGGLQYAKGQFFLEHMEHQFGREIFDAFMRSYFRHFRWQSITTQQFLDYLDVHLLSIHPDVYSRAQAEQWLFQPGLPEDFVPPRSETLQRAASAAVAVAAGEIPPEALARRDWSPHATVYFINNLPPDTGLDVMAKVDAAFGFSESINAEIGQAWFTRVAKLRYQPAYPNMEAFLVRNGRIKLIRPVYEALVKNGQDAALATRIFEEARSHYHPLTVKAVDKALAGTQVAQ